MKKIGVVVVVLWMLITAYGWGFSVGSKTSTDQIPTSTSAYNFTGQELLTAVNNHRISLGLKPITLNENFCNNIAQRYLDITNPDNKEIAHAGFQIWAKQNIPAGWEVNEILAKANTPEDVIEVWEGSPSHKIALNDPLNVYGCTYASNNWAIVELGHEIK